MSDAEVIRESLFPTCLRHSFIALTVFIYQLLRQRLGAIHYRSNHSICFSFPSPPIDSVITQDKYFLLCFRESQAQSIVSSNVFHDLQNRKKERNLRTSFTRDVSSLALNWAFAFLLLADKRSANVLDAWGFSICRKIAIDRFAHLLVHCALHVRLISSMRSADSHQITL